jgi:hypothetical protein
MAQMNADGDLICVDLRHLRIMVLILFFLFHNCLISFFSPDQGQQEEQRKGAGKDQIQEG